MFQVYELFLSNEHVQKYNPMCQVFSFLWGEAEGESVRGPGRARGAKAKGWRGVGAVGKARVTSARAK